MSRLQEALFFMRYEAFEPVNHPLLRDTTNSEFSNSVNYLSTILMNSGLGYSMKFPSYSKRIFQSVPRCDLN